ncbi:MAG: ATP-binding cassette domain-containing protein [Bacteroidetes bacterium]|nr:ATP-binding cassette domain-containing protein [Bacteroidota bacterium]
MFTSFSFFYCLIQFITILLLINERQNERITIGDFALVLGLNGTIIHLLWWNIKRLSDFSKLLGETQQALKAIFAPVEIYDINNAKTLEYKKGIIEFNNVTFGYVKNNPFFKNFSLKIKSKEKIGIVGYSGGGKSTFVKLLLRLYDLQKGEILIDGQNISKVTQESLRQLIGIIPQDPTLFHRTFRENILYGNTKASNKELLEASKKAHAHEFIINTPNKYETKVGERGIKISGGQRQRVSIARVILKDAPILVFDEATSQLDSITEKYIQNSMDFLMKDKTTIVIAHRLSTLLKMDRILVFDKGKIVEDGSHKELLNKKNHFYKLWQTQINGYINNKNEDFKLN